MRKIGAILVFALSWTLRALTQGGQLEGTLVTPVGAGPCSRCPVQIEDASGMRERNTLSDAQGKFYFTDLPQGTYSIRVRVPRFRETVQIVTVNSGTTRATVDLVLQQSDSGQGSNAGQVVDRSTFLDGYPRLAIEFYQQASNLNRNEKSRESLELFSEALRLAPNFYAAHDGMGTAYLSLGMFEEAERKFQTAGEINLSSADPIIHLGNLYILRNEWEKAAEASVAAIRREQRSPGAHFNLGVALYCSGMIDLSENALGTALRLDPANDQAHLMLVSLYLRSARFDDALKQIDEYLRSSRNTELKARVSTLRSQLRRRRETGAGFGFEFPVMVGPVMKRSPCGNA